MANYWIRNRGRVQGPLSLERIKGLMRRGRFSRHFHVSYDKKEWLPAEEFPELFETGRKRRGSSQDDDYDEDDTPFRSGGSPFDNDDEDDDDRPARKSSGKSAKRRAAVVDDEDDEDDDDDDDDEDWEDDDEWDDDEGGLLDSLTGLIEANIKLIAGVLVLVLLGLGWFMLSGEGYGQDVADLETLTEINDRITMANAVGTAPNEWLALQKTIASELAPLIDRLEDTANARDHVKQELLYIARDDFEKRFKELPDGIDLATNNIMQRFARIDDMIKGQTRQHPGTIMGSMMQRPAQASSVPGQPGSTPDSSGGDSQKQAEQDDGSAGQSQEQPGLSQPTGGNPNYPNPNAAAGGMSPDQANPNPGIPGQPPASKF